MKHVLLIQLCSLRYCVASARLLLAVSQPAVTSGAGSTRQSTPPSPCRFSSAVSSRASSPQRKERRCSCNRQRLERVSFTIQQYACASSWFCFTSAPLKLPYRERRRCRRCVRLNDIIIWFAVAALSKPTVPLPPLLPALLPQLLVRAASITGIPTRVLACAFFK